MEQLLKESFTKNLEEKLIRKCQHGFSKGKPNHACYDMTGSVDTGRAVDMLYCDREAGVLYHFEREPRESPAGEAWCI